jgi:hypothetical protein
MADKKIIDYIRHTEAAGYSPEQIYQYLSSHGISPEEIKGDFEAIKAKNRRKQILFFSLIAISGLAIVAAVVLLFANIGITSPAQTASKGVVVFTERSEYGLGEPIMVVVNNTLERNIFYSSAGDRFWDLERYIGNQWVNVGYKSDSSFQLNDRTEGDSCDIRLFERMVPLKLEANSAMSEDWNQKTCPFKTKIVSFIEPGTYRFVFEYGYSVSPDDPFEVLEPQTAYSDSFTIRG